MMRARTFFFVAFLLLCALLSGRAQSSWTLEQCIRVAREQHPRLRMAQNDARAAELSRSELRTTALPQVKLDAQSLYAPHRGHLGYDPAISNGGQLSGQLVVQQSLYDGGVRSTRSEVLQAQIEQRGTEVQVSERDVVFFVRQTFIEVLRTRREAELENESVAQLVDYLALVKRLTLAGSAHATDVLKTEVQLAQSRTALQRASASSALALDALAESMGIPPDSMGAVTGSLDALIPLAADTSLLRSRDLSGINLDIALAELEVRKSLLDIQLVQQEFRPTVSLSGDAGLVTSGDNLRLSSAERDPIFGFSVGLTAEIPLLNWNATGLRIQQKQLESENLRLQSDLVRRALATEARRLRLELVNAHERLAIARQTISGAENNFLLTKSKFAGGASLSLEVLAALQLLTDTRLAELQALADIQTIHARIEQFLTH